MARLLIAVFIVVAAVAVAPLLGLQEMPETAPMPVTQPPQLRPLEDARRLVVLLADNAGTETTDLLVPHGILERSGAVDVLIVATEEGPVNLMPALTVMSDMTLADFKSAYPGGADVVIVPAFHSRGTPATTSFIQAQAALGAMIVSICEGAEPVARAGVFEGRAATTHWFAQSRMTRRYPEAQWVRNTRYVVDGPVMSSSGVSASVPVTLKLLEILNGEALARGTASNLGVGDWGPAHDSSRFTLDLGTISLAAGNYLGFWRHESIEAKIADGFNGIALALQADAWSRTFRSRLIASNANGQVTSAEGVIFITAIEPDVDLAIHPSAGAPLAALEANLASIADRYGPGTANFVATQLEYDWSASRR